MSNTTQEVSCNWGYCRNPVAFEYRKGGGMSEITSEYRCAEHPNLGHENGMRVYRMVPRRRLVLVPEPL